MSVSTTKDRTYWNTPRGSVVLDNHTLEITVLVGEDCLYGSTDLTLALLDIEWNFDIDGWKPKVPTKKRRKNALHSEGCKMAFGKFTKMDGVCPRCDELKAGAKPRAGWGDQKKRFEEQSLKALKNHDCKTAGCGPVCTFGDW